VVEPGFSGADLLALAKRPRWVSTAASRLRAEGTAHEMWSQYHGTQPGDPAKLGDALVKIARDAESSEAVRRGKVMPSASLGQAIKERCGRPANEMLRASLPATKASEDSASRQFDERVTQLRGVAGLACRDIATTSRGLVPSGA